MNEQFKWISFYTEFATKLLEFKNNRNLLIEKIQKVYSNIGMKLPKLESNIVPDDIDPFTVFGLFNKGIKDANRIAIIGGLKEEFGINAEIPNDFSGIPVLNNMMSTFYAFKDDERRNDDDISNLWSVFETAINFSTDKSDEKRLAFTNAYNQVKSQFGVKWNLTMGLYWICPDTYINLDSRNRKFMRNLDNISPDVVEEINGMKSVPDADKYLSICDKCQIAIESGKYSYKSFSELSHKAWIVSENSDDEFWPSYDEYPVDLTKEDWKRFINEIELPEHKGCIRVLKCYLEAGGIGSPKRLSELYGGNASVYTSSVSNTCRRALKYFDMQPCADNKRPNKEWQFPIAFQGKKGVGDDNGYVYKMRPELMDALKEIDLSDIALKYNKEDDEMSEVKFDKNTILYGPPGTGKTYNTAIYTVAICDNKPFNLLKDYKAVMARYNELKTEGRVVFTTFHQSYGYEEFIEGIKPRLDGDDDSLDYTIEDGVFKEFCKRAKSLPDVIEPETKPYVFIIDEINRGNISKIFGELITLIEDTKREGMLEAASAKLPYSGEYFSVPSNVYIIGTMNTADRSIALMDTALRRRFQFKEMMPDVNVLRKLNADKVGELDIAEMLEKINERITFLYDREHTIGHAFFTGLKEEPTIDRLASIFKKSVIPLLQEYFYEDYQKIQMVLGDNGKTSDNYKFIKDTTVKATEIFKGSVEDVIDLPEKKYEINEDAFSEIQSYIEII